MKRALQFGAVLLLWAGGAFGDQKGTPQAPVVPRKGGAFKGAPKGAPKLANPSNVLERLMAMTPEQRDRVIEQLPPARQAQIRQRLERFDQLPPAEKERQLQRAQALWSLPPDKQNLVRRHIQAVNQLSDDRRVLVRQEYVRLSRMPEELRQARVNSEGFKNRFTPQEQEILRDLSEYYPLPGGRDP